MKSRMKWDSVKRGVDDIETPSPVVTRSGVPEYSQGLLGPLSLAPLSPSRTHRSAAFSYLPIAMNEDFNDFWVPTPTVLAFEADRRARLRTILTQTGIPMTSDRLNTTVSSTCVPRGGGALFSPLKPNRNFVNSTTYLTISAKIARSSLRSRVPFLVTVIIGTILVVTLATFVVWSAIALLVATTSIAWLRSRTLQHRGGVSVAPWWSVRSIAQLRSVGRVPAAAPMNRKVHT